MLQLCKKSLTCSECDSAWVSSQEHSCSSQFTSCRKGEARGRDLKSKGEEREQILQCFP